VFTVGVGVVRAPVGAELLEAAVVGDDVLGAALCGAAELTVLVGETVLDMSCVEAGSDKLGEEVVGTLVEGVIDELGEAVEAVVLGEADGDEVEGASVLLGGYTSKSVFSCIQSI
jgi:hypothetical protein